MRDPVECIKDLIGNPLFKEHMVYAPSQAYQDEAGSQRLIDDMWTADWWWDKQVSSTLSLNERNGLTFTSERTA
jgi:hypothetical protein